MNFERVAVCTLQVLSRPPTRARAAPARRAAPRRFFIFENAISTAARPADHRRRPATRRARTRSCKGAGAAVAGATGDERRRGRQNGFLNLRQSQSLQYSKTRTAGWRVAVIRGRSDRGSFHLSPRKTLCRRERAARAARHGRTGAQKRRTQKRSRTCRGELNFPRRCAGVFFPN